MHYEINDNFGKKKSRWPGIGPGSQERQSYMIPLHYQRIHLIILFLIVKNKISSLSLFQRRNDIIFQKINDIQKHVQDTPFIHVGNHSSLRDGFANHEEEYKSNDWEPIPTEKGEEMKNKIHA